MKSKKKPRETVSHDDYFMSMAFWTAARSQDPFRQEGAIIVDENNHILTAEPNGIPDNIKDHEFSWERSIKQNFVERAIENATYQNCFVTSSGDMKIYITAYPSKKCMRTIARAKIEKVIWFPLHKKLEMMSAPSKEDQEAVENISKFASIKLEEYDGNLNWMRDQIARFKKVGIFK